MPSAPYDHGLQAFLDGGIAWSTDTIKAVLVDVSQYGLAVTGATNAGPIVITTASAHGLTSGDTVVVKGVGGNAAANGMWIVTVINATQFSLNGSVGSGGWTSGGYVVRISHDQFLTDIPLGARLATVTLAGKTSLAGWAKCNDLLFSAVTGTQADAVVLYKDTGSAATSPLIGWFDDAPGFPFTPNGGAITLQWATSGAFRI